MLYGTALCLAGPAQARAQAQQRVALVIGNGAYPKAPLANPVSDAEDMAAALCDAGFDVICRVLAKMERADNALNRVFLDACRDSAYSKHLVEAIRTPGIKVEEALERVARAVNRETSGRQTPWVRSRV